MSSRRHAGGLVVHCAAGVSGLVAAIMLGARRRSWLGAHNLPMAMLGATLAFLGWTGICAGSALSVGIDPAFAMIATQVRWLLVPCLALSGLLATLKHSSLNCACALQPCAGTCCVTSLWCAGCRRCQRCNLASAGCCTWAAITSWRLLWDCCGHCDHRTCSWVR
jgi:Ammonium Transporter Family